MVGGDGVWGCDPICRLKEVPEGGRPEHGIGARKAGVVPKAKVILEKAIF